MPTFSNPPPLKPSMAASINMEELLRLEQQNARHSRELQKKQSPAKRRSAAKQRKAEQKRSRQAAIARSKSEKKARLEALRRRAVFETKNPIHRSSPMWYNQPPSFYKTRRRRR